MLDNPRILRSPLSQSTPGVFTYAGRVGFRSTDISKGQGDGQGDGIGGRFTAGRQLYRVAASAQAGRRVGEKEVGHPWIVVGTSSPS